MQFIMQQHTEEMEKDQLLFLVAEMTIKNIVAYLFRQMSQVLLLWVLLMPTRELFKAIVVVDQNYHLSRQVGQIRMIWLHVIEWAH